MRAMLILSFLALASCSSLHRADPAEFMSLAEVQGYDTAHSSRVIGVTGDRAYLEYANLVTMRSFTSSKPAVDVYWVPLAELAADERHRVRELARQNAAGNALPGR